jgi:hypothetical protein
MTMVRPVTLEDLAERMDKLTVAIVIQNSSQRQVPKWVGRALVALGTSQIATGIAILYLALRST